MRKQIVAGNWKMNQTKESGLELVAGITQQLADSENVGCEVIVCPPFPFLDSVGSAIKNSAVKLAAQNCNQNDSGAYTGEVSVGMLASIGVEYVLIGHSERREYFNESNQLLAEKTKRVLEAGIKPIFCCGEPLGIRDSETQEEFVCKQITESLFDLSTEDFSKVIIAYEPIWAIGTGKTASSQQAQDMHATIREHIAGKYGKEIAEDLTILYGGSCKPSNAQELFACKDVDGGLIGGASLKAEDFVAIINSFK